MRNSDPGVSIVSVHEPNSDLNSIFTMQKLVATSNTGPIFVFPWIHPFGCDAPSSLGRVYSRQATAWNCENSAVSFVMKYFPISTTFRNPASIQNLLNLSCCDFFSIRSPCCCNWRSFWPGHHNPKVLLSWSHLARVRNLIAPSQRVSPFFHEGFHTLQISPRLLRKDWAGLQRIMRKIVSIVSKIGCIVYRQFSMSLAFESASGQWARSTENGTSAFCEFH